MNLQKQQKSKPNVRFLHLGNKLRVLRKKNGLNQAQMAEALECGTQAYWKYEKGVRELPLRSFRKLIQMYDQYTVDWLLSDSDEELISGGHNSKTEGGAIDDMASTLKTLGETNKSLYERIAVLEAQAGVRTQPSANSPGPQIPIGGNPMASQEEGSRITPIGVDQAVEIFAASLPEHLQDQARGVMAALQNQAKAEGASGSVSPEQPELPLAGKKK